MRNAIKTLKVLTVVGTRPEIIRLSKSFDQIIVLQVKIMIKT